MASIKAQIAGGTLSRVLLTTETKITLNIPYLKGVVGMIFALPLVWYFFLFYEQNKSVFEEGTRGKQPFTV